MGKGKTSWYEKNKKFGPQVVWHLCGKWKPKKGSNGSSLFVQLASWVVHHPIWKINCFSTLTNQWPLIQVCHRNSFSGSKAYPNVIVYCFVLGEYNTLWNTPTVLVPRPLFRGWKSCYQRRNIFIFLYLPSYLQKIIVYKILLSFIRTTTVVRIKHTTWCN